MSEVANTTLRKSNRCWAVLIGCCISSAVGFTIAATCWSIFVTPLVEDLGINYTQANSYITVLTVASIFVMLVGDKILKLGAGKVTAATGILIGVAFAVLALKPSMGTITLAAVLNGIAYPMASLYAAPVLIKNWFHKKEGTFVGIALACIGVGGVIFAPLTTALIASYGWQQAMLILAAVAAIIQVLVGVFLIRTNPIPLGILPYGETEESMAAASAVVEAEEQGSEEAYPGMKMGDVFKSSAGWLVVACFIGLATMATVTTNLNPAVQKFGYAAAAAGIVLSFSSIGNITGKLVMGFVRDKKGSSVATLVASCMAIVGFVGYVLCFTVVDSVSLLCLSAFICGNGCCMATMMPPLLVLDAFGKKDYDRIYGVYSAARSFFQAIIVIVIGRMVDLSGSYMSTVIMWIVVAAVIIPLAFAAVKAGRRKWMQNRA